MATSVKLAVSIGPAYILILGYVAYALFRRWQENRYAPTLLLASVFGCFAGIAPLTLAALIQERLDPNAHATWLYLGLRLFAANSENLGVCLIAIFTWRVFRPTRLWALGLAGVIVLSQVAAKDLTLMLEPVAIWMPWQAEPAIAGIYIVGLVLNYGWLMAEAFGRWQTFRSDPKLDAGVVRRFFLWGLAGLALLAGTLASPQFLSLVFPSLTPTLEPFFALGPAALDRPEVPALVSGIVVTRFSCLLAFSVLAFLGWARRRGPAAATVG